MRKVNLNSYKKALRWIINILRKHKTKFNVLGGLAAYAYGSRRMLVDIDFAMENKDFEKILPEVKRYVIEPPHSLNQKDWRGYFMKLKYKGIIIEFGGEKGDEVFNSKKGRWEKVGDFLSKRPTIKKVFGINLPILPKRNLIKYKSKLNRKVDIVDLKNLTR